MSKQVCQLVLMSLVVWSHGLLAESPYPTPYPGGYTSYPSTSGGSGASYGPQPSPSIAATPPSIRLATNLVNLQDPMKIRLETDAQICSVRIYNGRALFSKDDISISGGSAEIDMGGIWRNAFTYLLNVDSSLNRIPVSVTCVKRDPTGYLQMSGTLEGTVHVSAEGTVPEMRCTDDPKEQPGGFNKGYEGASGTDLIWDALKKTLSTEILFSAEVPWAEQQAPFWAHKLAYSEVMECMVRNNAHQWVTLRDKEQQTQRHAFETFEEGAWRVRFAKSKNRVFRYYDPTDENLLYRRVSRSNDFLKILNIDASGVAGNEIHNAFHTDEDAALQYLTRVSDSMHSANFVADDVVSWTTASRSLEKINHDNGNRECTYGWNYSHTKIDPVPGVESHVYHTDWLVKSKTRDGRGISISMKHSPFQPIPGHQVLGTKSGPVVEYVVEFSETGEWTKVTETIGGVPITYVRSQMTANEVSGLVAKIGKFESGYNPNSALTVESSDPYTIIVMNLYDTPKPDDPSFIEFPNETLVHGHCDAAKLLER